jgi:hypothetical protein
MGRLEKKLLEEFLLKKEDMFTKFTQYVGIDKLSFDIEELKSIEQKAKELIEDDSFAELYNAYIGEILIKNISGGYWEFDNLKRDPAYHKPVILSSVDKNMMRLCPIADWFGLLKKGRLQEGISGIVEIVIRSQNRKMNGTALEK